MIAEILLEIGAMFIVAAVIIVVVVLLETLR